MKMSGLKLALFTLAATAGSFFAQAEDSGTPVGAVVKSVAETAVTLPADAQITIFAPNNEAFAAVGSVPVDALPLILANHIVEGALPVASVLSLLASGPVELTTFAGDTLLVEQSAGGVIISARSSAMPANIVETDIMTCVGVIHIIDSVLVPGAEGAMGPAAAPV